MTIEVATILGVWFFAAATAVGKDVTGIFLIKSFRIAILITLLIFIYELVK